MNNISGVGTAISYNTDTASLRNATASNTTSAPRQPSAPVSLNVELDKVTHQPVLPRFPWLSRLSAELAAAARQQPTFPPTASLGNNLDKKI